MAGEELGKISVQLEEEDHEVVAYFAFRQGSGWWGKGVEPFLGGIVSMKLQIFYAIAESFQGIKESSRNLEPTGLPPRWLTVSSDASFDA